MVLYLKRIASAETAVPVLVQISLPFMLLFWVAIVGIG